MARPEVISHLPGSTSCTATDDERRSREARRVKTAKKLF